MEFPQLRVNNSTTVVESDVVEDKEEPISLEQAWDPYQAPVFARTRYDSSEEGVDEDRLRKLLDWDDYRSFIDSLSDATSGTRGGTQGSPLRAVRRRRVSFTHFFDS